MINLQISEDFLRQVDESLLTQTAEAVFRFRAVPPNAEISIVIDDDNALQTLNKEFLGVDAPTDVLSFPADEIDPESGNPYLGDIIISFPRAQTQAEASGHALEAELQLLVVHGILHLLGMDHAEPDEKREMWESQTEILRNLNARLSRWPD